MPILMLIVKIGEWRLENWRTDEDALVEFLSLPSRRARPFFHLHVFIHKSLMGPEGSAFCIGMDVASRRSVFCLTFDSRLNGADLVRKIIKEICQSVIRENNDNPMNPPGKPYMLTTPDHFLYTSFVANFQRHGITILRTHKSGAQMMIIGEDRQNPVPLRAIAEALAATLDRDSGLMLKGEDLPPSAAESFRPSSKERFDLLSRRNLQSHQRLSSAANVTIYSRWRN